MPRRIALISEHASPLAAAGGVDSGGQNIYVAEVARHLASQGHDVDVFTRRDREGLPAVVDLGRLVPRKGVDNVIRGIARLVRTFFGIDAKLLKVGGNSDVPDPYLTPEILRLREIADAEGVAERVRFMGRRSRELLKLYYSAVDAFVTTPWYEPFGITPVEAMACGTPVIGSNVGGIKYTVVDGDTGFLVPPNDPEALAARLAALYADLKLGKKLGRRAARRARTVFTWSAVTASLTSVYENVTGEVPVVARPGMAAAA